ncbi:unnamed protein product [Lampetra fluviatilis]
MVSVTVVSVGVVSVAVVNVAVVSVGVVSVAVVSVGVVSVMVVSVTVVSVGMVSVTVVSVTVIKRLRVRKPSRGQFFETSPLRAATTLREARALNANSPRHGAVDGWGMRLCKGPPCRVGSLAVHAAHRGDTQQPPTTPPPTTP